MMDRKLLVDWALGLLRPGFGQGHRWLGALSLVLLASLCFSDVVAQDPPADISIVILPASGKSDVQEAIAAGQRMFEARLSAAGGFAFLGDNESAQLFQESREQTGVSITEIREAQLKAASRSYAEWAVGFSIEEVAKREYMVSLDVWSPADNAKVHADSEIVRDAGSMSAAARIGIDELAKRFLLSPAVIKRKGGNVASSGGRLDIADVSPVPMKVLVNGAEVGLAPGQFANLPVGSVSVELQAEGYRSVTRQVSIEADKLAELTGIQLEPVLVALEVRANVADAEIFVDDVKMGKTKAKASVSLEVPQGSKSLRFVRNGYQPVSIRVNLMGLTSHRVDVELKEHAGPNGQDLETADCSRVNKKDGMRSCLVPATDFLMGSSAKDAPTDTLPARSVTLSSPFLLYSTEVTVAQYRRCVDDGVCTKPGLGVVGSAKDNARDNNAQPTCNYGASGRDDHPMNCVNWHAAAAYCQWAGGDLPTEAQWELSSRGTDARLFPWANRELSDEDFDCATVSSALCEESAKGSSTVGDHPVSRSPYGIHDLAGNVAEWVRDTYEADAYQTLGNNDPLSETGSSRRVLRGGSYRDFPENLSGLARARLDANARPDHVGFRCVITP
ncbi:MAG: SUMF1/EgtB/PvdO family nonheme iron enzyme [Myxococcota bacterium]|jgi:formylglycine-generating enzyme required for sulfatase activity|nr:SUMF1/EgtB/PvdO family nonheme iron enzyme [Myxococcota bacterium]